MRKGTDRLAHVRFPLGSGEGSHRRSEVLGAVRWCWVQGPVVPKGCQPISMPSEQNVYSLHCNPPTDVPFLQPCHCSQTRDPSGDRGREVSQSLCFLGCQRRWLGEGAENRPAGKSRNQNKKSMFVSRAYFYMSEPYFRLEERQSTCVCLWRCRCVLCLGFNAVCP